MRVRLSLKQHQVIDDFTTEGCNLNETSQTFALSAALACKYWVKYNLFIQ